MSKSVRSTPSMSDLLEQAALDPPPGVVPHFSTYSDDQVWYIVAAVFCTVVPGILFILRLFTRIRIVRKVTIVDYAATVGFLGFFCMVVIGKFIFLDGAGVHQWNLKRKDLNNILYWMNVQNILYCPTIYSIKVAILLQYVSFLAPNRTVNPFLYNGSMILIALNLIYYIISMSVSIWACSPREKIWNDLIPGKCLNNDIMILITCLWNIVSDVIILLLPARTVWKMRIPTKKKVGIVLLFATGLLACITNAFIIMYLLRMAGADADATYNMAWLGLCVSAEISLGLTVISLLSLPKFIEATKGKHWFPRFVAKPFSSFSTSWSWGSLTRSTRATRTVEELEEVDSTTAMMSPPTIVMGQTLSEVQIVKLQVLTSSKDEGLVDLEGVQRREPLP